MTDLTVANTILSQLGGMRMLSMMTSAKEFVAGENSVKFKIGKNAKKVTHVQIVLDEDDTYTVKFMKWNGRAATMNILTEMSGIYCDMLMDIFENQTGLYLTFAPRS